MLVVGNPDFDEEEDESDEETEYEKQLKEVD